MHHQKRNYTKRKIRQRIILRRRVCLGFSVTALMGLFIWTVIPKEIDSKEQSVTVTSPAVTKEHPVDLKNNIVTYGTQLISSLEENKEPEPVYSEDELFCMAAAIYNEAGGDACSDDTRMMVGYVILNRVKDPRFPDTIREVLEARRQYGEFYWTGVKFSDNSYLPQEQEAVDRAYKIAERVLTEPSTIPETVVFQAEFEQGIGVYKYQDGIYFCHAKEVE